MFIEKLKSKWGTLRNESTRRNVEGIKRNNERIKEITRETYEGGRYLEKHEK